MDPRIGWHQNELSSSAYSTWTNIWMVAQLNCTAAAAANSLNSANSSHSASAISVNQLDHNNHNQLDRNTSNSYSKFISMIEMSSQQQQQQQYNTNNNNNSSNDYNNNNNSSNVNTSVTSQSILNGLKSRKFNKASTFGFNFPINQHILDDPMSTPWLMSHCSNSKNLLNSSLSLLFLSNSNSSSQIRNKSFQPLTHSHLSDEQSSYSSYLLNKTRNRSVTGSTSSSTSTSLSISSASSTSSSASSPTNISLHHPNHHLNHNHNLMISHDDDSSSLLSMANLSHLNSYEDDQLIQSTALINEINAPLISNNSTSNNVYSDGLMSLHKEILSFSEYIAPTLEELYMRNEIIWKITKIIKDELPTAEVDVFGSYKTGLFLPTSDIDMVVFGEFGKPNSLPLKVLRDALIKEKISNDENIRVLDKASVPIIKILETKTDIKVDISFNTLNGVKSAELIKKYLIEYPCLRPLVMVLKQFLIQRDFNEVWTGGIGSYSLILMTVSFLQLHPRIDARSCHANLGVLLIEFFELYGRCFNYMKTAIRILNGGCYLPKEEILKQFSTGYRSSVLCIEDPLNPANDIGKGSYGALKVKQAFEYAYFTLSHAVLPQNEFILKNNTQSIHQSQSILGRIIRITKEVRDYRSWVHEHFKEKVSIVYESNKQQQQHQQQTQQQQNELVILANGIDVDGEMKLVNEVKPVFSQPLPQQQQQQHKSQPIVSLTLPPQITLTVQPLDIQTNTSSTSASITCSSSSSSSSNTSNSISDDDQSNKENKIFDEIIFNHEKALGLNSINVLNNSNNHNHNHTNPNNSSSNLNILKDYQQNYHNSSNNNSNNNQPPPPPMPIHHQKSYEHSSKANNMNQTLTYLNQQYQQQQQQQQQHNNNVANNIKSNNRKKSNSSVRSFDSNESNNSNNSNNHNNNNFMNTNMNNSHYSVNNNSLQVIKAYNMNKKLKYTLDANTTSNGSNSNNNQKHSNQNQRFQTNKFNSNPNQMNNLNNNNKNNNKNNYGNSLNGGYHKQHNNNKYNNNNNNNNNSSQQFFQQQQQHPHHHHHHQHHSSQPIEQHKPVTFYLDEELQAMNNGRGAGAGGGGDEPELKRFINNLEANYLMQHSLLTPASAPISPCEFISKEDEPISRKKDPRNNSASLVDVSLLKYFILFPLSPKLIE